ncbi:MAG TPA: hypothetical protein VFD64_16030 [Gemmatimonadaceae bacterium]|nr:hypothetical protein [Gemmatimonadaceae bacterium]
MRARTGSSASALLVAATLLVPTPTLVQSDLVTAPPVSSSTQTRARANILVVGPSDSVGALVVGAVRRALASDTSGRPIWIIPQRDIDENLRLAGYQRSSQLTQADLRQFANFVRADMLVALSIEQSAAVLRVRASVAGRSDATAHDLSQNIVGSADIIGDQVVQALLQDSTYLRIRRR